MKRKLFLIFALILFVINPVFASSKKDDINDYINIAFTIDNNYPVYTMLLMESILKNNTSNSKYYFHVVEDNITKLNKKIMNYYAKQRGVKLAFYHTSTKNFDEGRNFYTFVDRITPIGMARITLPSLLPSNLHRVLYMDSDILVTTDIKPLYDTNLGNYSTGMIENIQYVEYDMMNFGKYYFNSGIMLMDLDKWRERKLEEKLTGYIKKNWKYFIYVDPVKQAIKELEACQAVEADCKKKKDKPCKISKECVNSLNRVHKYEEIISKSVEKRNQWFDLRKAKTGKEVDISIQNAIEKRRQVEKEYPYEISEEALIIRKNKFMYPDQDLINAVLNKDIKRLDDKWNMQYYAIDTLVGLDFKGVIHYIGGGKPWLNFNDFLPSYKLYHDNWKKSPLVVFLPICWYKLRENDKKAAYNDIVKMYKGEQ